MYRLRLQQIVVTRTMRKESNSQPPRVLCFSKTNKATTSNGLTCPTYSIQFRNQSCDIAIIIAVYPRFPIANVNSFRVFQLGNNVIIPTIANKKDQENVLFDHELSY